jgi:hypothetical protein
MLKKIKNWFCRKSQAYIWDSTCHDQDESEIKPPGASGLPKYEINISKKGKHIFATDSHIRNYTPQQICDLILLFKNIFPKEEEYKITVTSTWRVTQSLPDQILEALK